jgi:hypothetical protein
MIDALDSFILARGYPAANKGDGARDTLPVGSLDDFAQ